MKKILIAVILFCSLGGYAQINIKQGFGIEYFVENGICIESPLGKLSYDKGMFACLYKIKAEYKSFSINALTNIYMNKSQSYQFTPCYSEFTINLSYQLSKLTFKVEHQCLHSIYSKNNPPKTLSGGFTKFGVYFDW